MKQKKRRNVTDNGAENRRSDRRNVKQTNKKTVRHGKNVKKKRVVYDGGISGDLIYAILMTIALVAAIGFATTQFFKVSDIEVIGNERTSASEIRSASGIAHGDKLFYLNGFEISRDVSKIIPYVDEVRIKRRPPSTVVLDVTECVPVAAISCGGVYYVIDKDCKLLEYFPITGKSEYPVITGLNVISQTLGETVDVEDELRLVSLRAIASEVMTNEDVAPRISELNMEKLYDVSFMYDGRLRVDLGEADSLTKKVRLFNEVLEKLEESDKGTVSLKNTESITFLPN